MRRVLALLASMLLIVSACAGDDAARPESDDTTAASISSTPATSDAVAYVIDPLEDAIAARLADDGTVPLDTAVDLFAAAFGPFPGADAEGFPEADPHTGTVALMAVAAHYDELTSEQREAVVDAVEGPGRDTGTRGEVFSMEGPAAVFVSYGRVAQPVEPDFPALAIEARDEIARRAGRPLTIPVRIVTREGTDSWAVASPMRDGHFIADGTPDECLVELWPERITTGDASFVRSVITHEVFHCFQYTAYDDLAVAFDSAPWITEGQAFWAAAEIVGISQPWVTNGYAAWLCRPEVSLWKQIRGAMGFYSAAASHGFDAFWETFDDMLGRVTDDAVEALGIPAVEALGLIATTRMNDTDAAFGDLWALEGIGVPATACRGAAGATPSDPWDWESEVQDFASGVPFVVDVSGDVVRVDAAGKTGLFEFSDGTKLPWSDGFTGLVCLREGGCVCPDGSTIGDSAAAPGPVAVGVGGRAGKVTASLLPFTLEDACALPAVLPRMSLTGNPTVNLEGGSCVLDGPDLVINIGYVPSYDALLQPEPFSKMNALIFVRAVPGTWDTGSFYITPVPGEGFRSGDGGLLITIAPDLLTGSFTWKRGSGFYSCPRLMTPEEALAGPS